MALALVRLSSVTKKDGTAFEDWHADFQDQDGILYEHNDGTGLWLTFRSLKIKHLLWRRVESKESPERESDSVVKLTFDGFDTGTIEDIALDDEQNQATATTETERFVFNIVSYSPTSLEIELLDRFAVDEWLSKEWEQMNDSAP